MLKQIKASEGWSEKTLAEQGFTLVELLVVIAILGILAVVAVLSFGGLTTKAKTSVVKTEVAEVKTAAQAFAASSPTGAAPGSVAAMVTDGELTTATLKCTYTFALDANNNVVTTAAGSADCVAAN